MRCKLFLFCALSTLTAKCGAAAVLFSIALGAPTALALEVEVPEEGEPPGALPVIPPESDYRFEVKGLGIDPSASFFDAHAGRINDDPRQDIVVLRGTSPILFVNPASWDAALRIPLEGSAVAILPADDPDSRDEVLVTTAEGLRAATRQSATDTFDVRTIGNDWAWEGAELVATSQLDDYDSIDVYGVRNDFGYALVNLALPDGDDDGFTDEILIPLAAYPVIDGTAADLDGNGLRSLAFCSAAGLHIYHEDNGQTHYPGGRFGRLATIRSQTTGQEVIVWIAHTIDSGDLLYLIDNDGISDPIALGNLGVVGLTATDLDDDDQDDLVISFQRAHSLKIFWNDNGVFDPDTRGTNLDIGESGTAGSNEAAPAAADLDGDGDVDLFHLVQSSERAFVWRNTRTNSNNLKPVLVTPTRFNFVARDGSDEDPIYDGYLQIELADAPAIPADATHVELFLWRKDSLETPTSAGVEPGQGFRFPIGGPYETGVIVLEEPDPSLFFWMHQYITVDGNDVRTAMYPPGTFAFSTETPEALPNLEWLLANATARIHSNTVPDPVYQDAPPGTILSETVSTIVTVDPIVAFDDDDEPEDDLTF